MTPLVSVIIPTYNFAGYIRRAIDSVLQQTYSNIEVIVVDDGSTDNTQAVLACYGDRIRNILQANRGASAARNRGIREVHGDYIAFLDADDCYCPDNIAEKVGFLTQHAEYAWCYSNWAWIDTDGAAGMLGSDPANSLARLKAHGDVFLLALQGYQLQTDAFLFKKAVIDWLGGFDETLTVLEDYDLYVRAASRFPLAYIDKTLFKKLQNPGSLSTSSSKRTGYYCRWHLNHKLSRMFPDQIRQIARFWDKNQSDVYRNLAELALAAGHPGRARVLARASMARKCWQPGIVPLLWKIGRGVA
jgi:glycosyltransferase involved in cell wall biosynthesis